MNILKKCEKQNRYEGQRATCWTGGGVGQMQKKKIKPKERAGSRGKSTDVLPRVR